jgi:hypothetical protein
MSRSRTRARWRPPLPSNRYGYALFLVWVADSMRGLVAALLDDSGYEAADPASRLAERLRIANDVALLAELDGRHLDISDGDGPETIVIASDEPFVHSLQNAGLLTLADMRTGL